MRQLIDAECSVIAPNGGYFPCSQTPDAAESYLGYRAAVRAAPWPTSPGAGPDPPGFHASPLPGKSTLRKRRNRGQAGALRAPPAREHGSSQFRPHDDAGGSGNRLQRFAVSKLASDFTTSGHRLAERGRRAPDRDAGADRPRGIRGLRPDSRYRVPASLTRARARGASPANPAGTPLATASPAASTSPCPCPAFQVSGRSLSDALERGMTTYREVVMAVIST